MSDSLTTIDTVSTITNEEELKPIEYDRFNKVEDLPQGSLIFLTKNQILERDKNVRRDVHESVRQLILKGVLIVNREKAGKLNNELDNIMKFIQKKTKEMNQE